MRRRLCLTAAAITLALFACAGVADAATPAANWSIESLAYPSDFSTDDNALCEHVGVQEAAGQCDTYVVTSTNVGSKETDGTPVTLSDTLPGGLTVRNVSLFVEDVTGHTGPDLANENNKNTKEPFCSSSPVRCVIPLAQTGRLKPGQALKMYVSVLVSEPAAAGPLLNTASVSGGILAGAREALVSSTNTLEQGPAPFGLSAFDSPFVGVDGLPETQAGAHPYELDTTIAPNTTIREIPEGPVTATSVEDLRDAIVDLPLGVAGSGVSAPQCTLARLASRGPGGENNRSGCPAETILGRIRTYPESTASAISAIYNLVPEKGVAAELGFIDAVGGGHILYISLAPTPAGYVLRTTSREIPQIWLTEVIVSVFGNPAARDGSSQPAPPTFTNPASCTGEPLITTIHTDSWQHPGAYNADGTPNLSDLRWSSKSYQSPPVTGCEALEGLFGPSIAATPTTANADSPSGLDVNLTVPQHTGAEELATPPLRDTTVTLPAGMTINPSSANGLQACSLEQVGMSPSGVPDTAPPRCPDGAKIGTVELETPALAMEVCKKGEVPLQECPAGEHEHAPLSGSIYVARQTENPFGSLLAIYIVIDDPRTGVIVKLPAEVKPDPATGQLTTLVRDTPQFPFSELRTHFFAGPTAALRTPPTCGAYTLTSELTPWSAPQSGPASTPSSSFEITEGPGGSPCAHSAGEEPNAPSFQAGVQSPTAAAYSPLMVHLNRDDGSQNFSQISVTLPPGATGKLAGIPRCSDAQIAAAQARSHPGEGAAEAASPSCPASSAIGTVTVGAGAGPSPFYVTGKAFLAGPYKGAPFSGVFITPAIAGPFDLGVVVVRAGLYINPNTAQVTTTSDPLPSILQGIPLDIRSVTVNVDRPQFTLNPTNCTPMTVSGQETSTQGQVAPLSARFQVGNCANLPFHPKLTASAAGKASKANGATLNVDVTSAGLGQANIAKVSLQLPKALPSRLTTIQKACVAATFNANPAACPEGSVIGMATIRTPLLDNALSGPAYLVSYGNAAFPDVEFVLQGEGVTLILDGKTDIKKGITYSRFESAPDAPFTTFETVLPAGPHSALTANVAENEHFSLCKSHLAMPTEMTAQNGAVIKQTTKVAVTGCPKVKTLSRAQKLAAALKVCKKKAKRKRAACQKLARKRYGPARGKKGSKTKKH
jgi:uncharacterized repeat protein (TIGR01451 family)